MSKAHEMGSLEGEERRVAFNLFRHACWFDGAGEPSDEAIENELTAHSARESGGRIKHGQGPRQRNRRYSPN